MTEISLGMRCASSIVKGIKKAPANAIAGALFGCVYAKFSNLSVKQAAFAYSIWTVAQATLFQFNDTVNFKINPKVHFFCDMGIRAGVSYLSIQELQKRRLIGPKMILFSFCFHAFIVTNYARSIFFPKKETEE